MNVRGRRGWALLAFAVVGTVLTGWHAAAGLPAKPARVALGSELGHLVSADWSPDGGRIACGTDSGHLVFFDARTTRPIGVWRFPRKTHLFALSPDWKRVASLGSDGRVRVWDVATRRLLRSLPWLGTSGPVVWSPDGKLLAIADRRHARREWVRDRRREYPWLRIRARYTVQVWDAAKGTQVSVLRPPIAPSGPPEGHEFHVFQIAWHPDSRRLATAIALDISGDSRVRLWDVTTGTQLRVLDGREGMPIVLAWSPDGGRLAAAESHGIRIWDPSRGKTLARWHPGDDLLYTMRWSPDGTRLAVGGDTHPRPMVRVLEAHTGKERESLHGHPLEVADLDWSPDGKRVVSVALSGSSTPPMANQGKALVWTLRSAADRTSAVR